MIGYKLFKVKKSRPGELFPLYVTADKPTPTGKWISAEVGQVSSDGKHVKSKLGDLALRPGWHLNKTIPYVNHIGKKDENGNIAYLPDDLVWCEVEYSDKVNYQSRVDDIGRNSRGVVIPKNACMKEIPVDGYYLYKTNTNQIEPWVIAGAIKINRILSDEEVDMLCKRKGIVPLPRFGGEFKADVYGFAG